MSVAIEFQVNEPRAQTVENIASYSLETKRTPDPYSFKVDRDGDLFSPSAGRKVKEVITRDNYIGKVEGDAFDFINQRVKENKDNPDYREVFGWVSGPYQGVYSDLKVVISEIQGKGCERKLFNTAIIFDFNEAESLDFSQRLALWNKNRPEVTDLEEMRATPLILDTSDAHWTDILQSIVGRPELWEFIRREEDKRAKLAALIQADKFYEAFFRGSHRFMGWAGRFNDLLKQFDLLGANNPHCPLVTNKVTGFKAFFESSFMGGIIKQYPDFPCPNEKCDQIIESGKGITECPKCHAKKEDYANCD